MLSKRYNPLPEVSLGRRADARGRHRGLRRTTAGGVTHGTMLVVAAAMLYPMYFIIVTAFKTRTEFLTNRLFPPAHPTLENFRSVFRDGELLVWMGNSAKVTIASVIIATVIGGLAAYPLSRRAFLGRKAYLEANVALLVVPPVVLVVPLFLLFVKLGLINSHISVILIYVGLLVPFAVFLLTGFFATIPRSLEEAARMDGAPAFQILVRIFLPLSAPALVTIMIVSSVWVWNELLIALIFLQDNQSRTLMAGLTLFQGRFVKNEPLIMTGALIAAAPMLALYLVGQKFFIRGLTAGFNK